MKRKNAISAGLAAAMLGAAVLSGCGADETDGRTEIEILQYKPEAAAYFDQVEEAFNASHEDIHLTISSPNDASTIMRTRFVREDYPDIIGIGGDINYSYYVDADILAWPVTIFLFLGLITVAFPGKQSYGDCCNRGALDCDPFPDGICGGKKQEPQQRVQFHLSVYCQRYVRAICDFDDASGETDGGDAS